MEEKMKEEMEELVQLLNKASKEYYSGKESDMSDKEYDALYDKLAQMETETGIILPNSPTQRVGYEVVTELKKVKHAYPALSLDKTKDREFLQNWLHGKDGVLSWKMDGLTAVATWKDGKLNSLVTRGNGIVGEDVTHNAPYIEGLPSEIPEKGEFVVRGEVVISYDDFEEINRNIFEVDDKFKNPRNLAASSLRAMDSKVAAERHMHFLAFNLVACENKPKIFSQCLLRMITRGIDIVPYSFIIGEETIPWNEYEWQLGNHGPRYGVEETSDAFDDPYIVVDLMYSGEKRYQICVNEEWNYGITFENKEEADEFAKNLSKKALFPYPTDGLVLTYNDIPYGESLGTTGKFPKNAIAFKWADTTVETTLRDVEWSASRSGLLNPVAIFDPVELEGTTVSRASLHNITYMKDLQLGYNDTVTVYKANMIIPQLDENISMNGEYIQIPKVCPICGEPTEQRWNEEGSTEFLYCTNKDCPAKHAGKFARMAERDALNIVGLSKATVERFVSAGMLKEFADIYHLDRYKDEIIEMDGFGEKSYQKMIDSIEKSRNTTFRQFFYALGIPGAGHDVAKILEHYLAKLNISSSYTNALYVLLKSKSAFGTLVQMDGVGDITARTILNWFSEHQEEYLHLANELYVSDPENTTNVQTLSGVTVVITGSLHLFTNRDALKKEIENRGGKVSGSVSKNTSYLINNDVESASGKNKKAKELGISILSEQEFANQFLS